MMHYAGGINVGMLANGRDSRPVCLIFPRQWCNMSTNQHDPPEAPSDASEADRYKYITGFADVGNATVTAKSLEQFL